MDLLILHRQRIEVAIFDSVLHSRAFQFAIQIDSIRYANRFESIRFVKKSAFRFTRCHAVFLFIYCIVSAKK